MISSNMINGTSTNKVAVRSSSSRIVYSNATGRRQAGAIALIAGLMTMTPSVSNALLLPDDSDQQLKSTLKSERGDKRLNSEAAKARQLLDQYNYGDISLENQLQPTEDAILQFRKIGALIDEGDIAGANSVLSKDLIDSFAENAQAVSLSEDQIEATDRLLKSVDSLKSTLGGGDNVASKKAFASTVVTLEYWAKVGQFKAILKNI